MLNFDRIADNNDKAKQRENTGKTQRQVGKKKRKKSSLYLLLLGFCVLIVAGIVYSYWPTIKGSQAATKIGTLLHKDVSLTGIFFSEDNPAAVVEGKIAHEEDVIDGIRIVKIHKEKVEFEKSGRRWCQSMAGSTESAGTPLPALLQLGSSTCPPCRQMKPILNELRTEYASKFEIRYIDVRGNKEAGPKYGVRKIPTQIFYDSSGKEVFRHVGFYSRKEIVATWIKLGVKL